MLSNAHTQRVLALASRKALLRASDLDVISAPRVILTRLTAAGRLVKVGDRKSTRLNSSHDQISYAVFCLKKKKKNKQ